jgi:hypothetical protein
MKDNLFNIMQDKDWSLFRNFVKKKLVESFIINKHFNEYWFKKKKWSIFIKKTKSKIDMLNMFLVFKAKFFKKKINLCWTSTGISTLNLKSKGVFGLSMLHLNKIFPIVIMACGNHNSLPINQFLGKDLNKLNLRRFIFSNNLECLKIIKAKKRKIFKKKIFTSKKIFEFSNLTQKLEKKTPKDLNNLWNKFSSNFSLSIIKNYEYFKWRYEKAPYQKYYFLTFRDKKKATNLCGISIIKFQITKFGVCSRIVDFMSASTNLSNMIWQGTIAECMKKDSLFVDFIIFGTGQDEFLKSSGFRLINHKLKEVVPNLLSPIENRDWSYSFHIGGYLSNLIRTVNKNKVWFTKGDGDRDWPTPYELKRGNYE